MKELKIELGPSHDKRLLEFSLPDSPKRIGVLVSGGLDSAILLYIIKYLNQNNFHKIVPLTIERAEGSKIYAPKVLDYINSIFINDISNFEVIKLPKIPPHIEVTLAIHLMLRKNLFDVLYLGVIQTREEHAHGITIIKPSTKIDYIKYPLIELEKSHIVDLIYKMKQEYFLDITTSCDTGENCGTCNGCNERAWGIDQIKSDLHNP